MNFTSSGVEWIAAVLAPWTISPHPNFSAPSLNAAADLALVTESRAKREISGRSSRTVKEPALPEWAESLVKAAQASQVSETQKASLETLRVFAGREDLPLGFRAASALYAAVTLADRDLPQTAIELLGLIPQLAPPETTLGHRISLAAVWQQIALRYYDLGNRSAAAEAASRAHSLTTSQANEPVDEFAVSPGISWGSKRIQQDLLQAIRYESAATLAVLEDWESRNWERLVRTRTGWLQTKALNNELSRDSLVVRDEFERRIEALSGTTHFMRETPLSGAYSVLLLAELSGSISRTRRAREALGKILMLQRVQTEHSASEAIRSFRRAGAEKPLQSTLNWLRSDGPTSVLVEETRHILLASEYPPSNEALKVLEYSAEFLDSEIIDKGISYALSFDTQPRTQFKSSSSYKASTWKAISRLAPGSNSVALVLDPMLSQLETNLGSDPLVTDPMARTLMAIGWSNVPPSYRSRLRTWAEQPKSVDSAALRAFILDEETNTDGPTKTPVDRAIQLVNNPTDRSSDEIQAVEKELIAAIDREQKDAAHGSYSFGGANTVDVAVAFAGRYSLDALWRKVLEAILNPSTHPSQKSAALDRIAVTAEKVPAIARTMFQERWEAVIAPNRQFSLFGNSLLSVDPAILRAGLALKVIPPATGIDLALSISAESTEGRLESAKALSFLVPSSRSTAQGMLLMLSYDENPDVRAEAAYSLAVNSDLISDVSEVVIERLTALARMEGVRIPLRLFHGLQFLRQGGRRIHPQLVEVAESIADCENAARVVRGAAARVIAVGHEE